MLTFLADTCRHEHENPYTDQDQDDPSEASEKELVGYNQRGDYRKSKDRDRRVERICGGDTKTGGDAMEAPVCNRPLDAQQRDRADRYCKGKTDNDSLDKDTEIHTAPYWI